MEQFLRFRKLFHLPGTIPLLCLRRFLLVMSSRRHPLGGFGLGG